LQRRSKMSQRATSLFERFTVFNNEMIAFVEKCADENWAKICPAVEPPDCCDNSVCKPDDVRSHLV